MSQLWKPRGASDLKSLVVVGPLPPPANGMTEMTLSVLRCGLPYRILHVATSDHRHLSKVGRLDVVNARLALQHLLCFAQQIRREPTATAYIPVAQGGLGYFRDACMIAIASLYGRRIVVHLHGGAFRDFYRSASMPMRLLIECSMKRVHVGIVLADCLRNNFADVLDAHRIVVVRNGIPDPGRPHPVCSVEAEPSKRLTVLHISTLQESKGSLDVLRAARLVQHHLPHASFVLAGPWRSKRDETTARELAARCPDPTNIVFTGEAYGEAKEALFRKADVLVMPTYYPYEGQPVVVLEAMAHGLPVVATGWAGLGETVGHGECGPMIRPRDPEGLAAAIVDLACHPTRMADFGTRARTRYLAMHTLDAFRDGLVSAIELASRVG